MGCEYSTLLETVKGPFRFLLVAQFLAASSIELTPKLRFSKQLDRQWIMLINTYRNKYKFLQAGA
jgi:hypothetical protein